MADPLSPIASIIAIAVAASQICKAISRLRAFGEVPGRVYSLRNEVTDLEVVLRQVAHALQQNSLAPDTDQKSLRQILERTRGTLVDLAKALERVGNAFVGGKVKIITRSAIWFKEREPFQAFQDDIRAVKESLNIMLGASNSRDLQHIILELRRVSILTSNRAEIQERYSELIGQAIDDHHSALSSRMNEQYQSLNDRLDALGRIILAEKLQDEKHPDEIPILSEKESSKIETFRVLISNRTPYRNWCPCACHAKRKAQVTMPGIMESLVGKMFVGYTGLPVRNKRCDFRGCRDQQKSAVTMEYWFPWWFISRNLRVYLKCLPSTGPQFQLSTARRVPDTSQSITFAMQGNIEGLKYMFKQGLASPRDVSESRGFSLVRWALYGGMHQHETVQFLIDQGALVDEVSYDNVWDFIFRGKCNDKEARALRCITQGGDGDWVEEQNFPLAHRIIFGLFSKSLEVELLEKPNAVYATDVQGRTALDWATARAQLEDISLLLSYGADPNNMDLTGRTTILHAVDSHSVPGLRLILEAGGNPNPILPKGVFRSSPLTAAGFAGIPEMLKLLLEFGANPNACNPEGLTSLHSVARTQNVDCALLLLEFGADLNAVSSNGRTPLTTAIIHNNHQVLQLFVDRCYEYIITTRLTGSQLLPIIAEHADIETMLILASSHPLKLSYDLEIHSINASRDILQQRRDCSEKLSEAFEELITIAQAEKAEAGSIDTLMESGLFLSARSSFHSELAEAVAELNYATINSSDGSVDEEEGPEGNLPWHKDCDHVLNVGSHEVMK
ncbi:hypothetical protein PRK78_004715 [Emydomyces testavorans]|uniref:Fungal N-terminal domain-containing protein n=1 Tax=Emydomyces testavorans TaxID=2070801 RepID=A0AAF0IK15_9EURO|nr:hypothetical protein PRK78_004715 [Emydomyces testavorans]